MTYGGVNPVWCLLSPWVSCVVSDMNLVVILYSYFLLLSLLQYSCCSSHIFCRVLQSPDTNFPGSLCFLTLEVSIEISSSSEILYSPCSSYSKRPSSSLFQEFGWATSSHLIGVPYLFTLAACSIRTFNVFIITVQNSWPANIHIPAYMGLLLVPFLRLCLLLLSLSCNIFSC